MPAVVKVKVIRARDLPIMDRSSELTDAFVEVCTRPALVRYHASPPSLSLLLLISLSLSCSLHSLVPQIRLAQGFHKTEVCHKTLNPQWDPHWYTFTLWW